MTQQERDDLEADEDLWQAFAHYHPHEAYETWPDRFWAWFHQKYPDCSRERMERCLRETDDHPAIRHG